jgi:RNA polymerase-binding transcription factor DksA
MNRASTRQRDPRTERFRKLLLTKRFELKSSLEEMKFDTIARMGRIAEEDQAMLSHDEFISLRRNSLEYEKLRQVEAALDRIASGDYGVCLE